MGSAALSPVRCQGSASPAPSNLTEHLLPNHMECDIIVPYGWSIGESWATKQKFGKER